MYILNAVLDSVQAISNNGKGEMEDRVGWGGGGSVRPNTLRRFTLAGEERLGDPTLLQARSIHIETDTHLNSLS